MDAMASVGADSIWMTVRSAVLSSACSAVRSARSALVSIQHFLIPFKFWLAADEGIEPSTSFVTNESALPLS